MGKHQASAASDEALRAFMRALLADVAALEKMLQDGLFETGVRRIGAEQEMFLVDRAGRPANRAVEVMGRLGHDNFTHELALFNLEANLSPQEFGGSCLRAMEDELRNLLGLVNDAAHEEDCEVVLTGILPTLRLSHLGIETFTDTHDWRASYVQVGQFMTTDLFTVHPEDIVDLAASLMDWRHIRHVPVEDAQGRLVGLVSHRSLLRLVGHGVEAAAHQDAPIAVKDIMNTDPVYVSPDTATLAAIELMRERKVGCLPVVERERLVGIITERDLITVASALFERHLRETTPE